MRIPGGVLLPAVVPGVLAWLVWSAEVGWAVAGGVVVGWLLHALRGDP